ncbi:LacI family DNA-binding transcriptional regulator [Bacillus sp. FSL K6-3431]|uniref:LacI family DNA-binding transcriptional regulator n=1 Tax=Bacillus sp. FSL K6-3431 TaxID=2921500 RepID=UPI0030F9A300
MSNTITDVAKKANVSIATVSRILNNQKGYSEKTKKKVLQVIEELGYEPNAIARGLINKKTETIGVLFPSLSSLLTSEFLNGIESIAHAKESSIIVCHTADNGERTMKYLQLLNEKRIDGLIFTSALLKEEYYEYMKKMKVPAVLLSTKSIDYPLPYVKVDDHDASYAATQYLIQKGHKDIGMLSGNKSDPISGRPRIEGYKQALQENNLTFEENAIVECKGFSYEDGKDNLERLVAQAPHITAMFAASDEIAIGAMSAAYRLGIKVPDDLSIIGYDNLKISEMTVPPLTTVAQPLFEMGAKAADQLFKMVDSIGDVYNITMPHQIIERNSVKKFD